MGLLERIVQIFSFWQQCVYTLKSVIWLISKTLIIEIMCKFFFNIVCATYKLVGWGQSKKNFYFRCSRNCGQSSSHNSLFYLFFGRKILTIFMEKIVNIFWKKKESFQSLLFDSPGRSTGNRIFVLSGLV